MVDLSIDLPKGFLDEEPRTLIVSRRRKEVWAVELDLLVQLDRVCKKHGIRYFCDGGTVLGAIRHRGFIPWDDDIDVIMSRSEYEKLNAVAPTEFQHPYFWQTNATDPGSARGHAQLRNSETTGILKSEMASGKAFFDFNQGLFIDIFPFDNLPDDPDERRVFRERLRIVKEKIAAIMRLRIPSERLPARLSVPRKIFRFLRVARLRAWERLHGCDALACAIAELDKLARSYNDIRTKEVAPITLDPFHREVLPAHFLDDSTEVDFEFLKIPVLVHHMESLAINYGRNWREHVIGAAAHSGMFVDTNRSYADYLSSRE